MRRKVLITLCLLSLGVISTLMLTSIAPKEAPGQAIFVTLGIGAFWVLQLPMPRLLEKSIPIAAVITFLLLMLTLFVGRLSHGAQRWLPVGQTHVQVSEFAKPVIALFLAWYVVKFPLNSQGRLLVYFLFAGLFFAPVFLQPDLGSGLVSLVVAVTIVFMSVRRLRMLFPWFAFAAGAGFLVWNFALYPYQKDRLLAFTSGSGAASYNAEQALVTVGSGKLLGRGLGHGVQSQLRFLPEFHTDFFFASLAEELGALGAYLVLGIYAVLFWQLLALKRTSKLAELATYGFVTSQFFQMSVHIGMNMRLFPITGIPLPLLSSGGSSVLAICLGFGVLVRLSDARQFPVLKAVS